MRLPTEIRLLTQTAIVLIGSRIAQGGTMLRRFRCWLVRLLGGGSVLITVRLRGCDNDAGPIAVASGDRIELADAEGWAGTVLAGPPTPARWHRMTT
jgi:hypothetical protein